MGARAGVGGPTDFDLIWSSVVVVVVTLGTGRPTDSSVGGQVAPASVNLSSARPPERNAGRSGFCVEHVEVLYLIL